MNNNVKSDLIKASSIEVSEDESGRSVIEKKLSVHSDTFPAPQTLREYDQVLSGLSERRIKMAESDQLHAQSVDTAILEMHRRAMELEAEKDKRNTFVAIIIAICVLLVRYNKKVCKKVSQAV